MKELEEVRVSRRAMLGLMGTGATLGLVGGAAAAFSLGRGLPSAAGTTTATASTGHAAERPSPDEALAMLVEGNKRWVSWNNSHPNQSEARRLQVAAGQAPWAVIFSCIDSRVPPELVFDRGLGDMFVVRTAGHVIDNAALGSIEFGVEEIHVPLVVVMGHERCGAVVASIEAVERGATAPGQINALVQGIRPAIEGASHTGDATDNVVRKNTSLTVAALKADPLIAAAIGHGAVKVIGARYDLDSGLVDWTP